MEVEVSDWLCCWKNSGCSSVVDVLLDVAVMFVFSVVFSIGVSSIICVCLGS